MERIDKKVLKELKQYILAKRIPSLATVGLKPSNYILIRQCKYCNNTFETNVKQQYFCSKKCRIKSNNYNYGIRRAINSNKG